MASINLASFDTTFKYGSHSVKKRPVIESISIQVKIQKKIPKRKAKDIRLNRPLLEIRCVKNALKYALSPSADRLAKLRAFKNSVKGKITIRGFA
jgi:hypothetical protein